LLRQRKSKQKKGDRKPRPYGVPDCAAQKMGNERNSPSAQTTFISDPFSVPHNRRGSERLKVKDNGKFKKNGNQILQF